MKALKEFGRICLLPIGVLFFLLFFTTAFAVALLGSTYDYITNSTSMKKTLLALPLLLLAFVANAQDPTFPPANLTPDNLFGQLYDPIYSALVIGYGYLSQFIPGIKKFSAFGRVLAFGLVAGLGFYLFGGASVWKVGLSFLISTGLIYDGFLKPFTGLLQNILKKSPAKG